MQRAGAPRRSSLKLTLHVVAKVGYLRESTYWREGELGGEMLPTRRAGGESGFQSAKRPVL